LTAIAPRLPVIETVETAIRRVGTHLPSLAILYALVWLGLQTSAIFIYVVFGAVHGSRFTSILVLLISVIGLAIFGSGALRIELLGERPSRDVVWWWNAGTCRVAVVILLVRGVDMVLTSVLTPFLMTRLETENLFADESAGGLVSLSGHNTLLWINRLLLVLAWTALYGQAATVIARGRFDWREHLSLLRTRPLRLIAVALLSAIMIFGFALIWVHIIGLTSKAAVPVSNDVRDVAVPILYNNLRSAPYFFLKDSFVFMTLAAAYRRLSGFRPATVSDPRQEPNPSP
jgi:hypothetical protein